MRACRLISTLFPYTTLFRSHEIPDGEEGADAEAEHHAEAGERERARRREEPADVAAERQHGARAHREPAEAALDQLPGFGMMLDRKSTRLNSSHLGISYAVF